MLLKDVEKDWNKEFQVLVESDARDKYKRLSQLGNSKFRL